MLKFYLCTESFFTIEGPVDEGYAISPDRVRYFTEGNYYTEAEIGDCEGKFERTSLMFEAIDNVILAYNTACHVRSSRIVRKFKRDLDLSMDDDMALVTLRRTISRLDRHKRMVETDSEEHLLLKAEHLIFKRIRREFYRIQDEKNTNN